MDSIFNTLCVGAKFNRNKNKESLKLFSGNDQSNFLNIFDKNPHETTIEKASKKRQRDEISTNELCNEEEVNSFRNRLQIRVKGSNVPTPNSTFQEMDINKEIKSIILQNIENSEWKEPTPIQMQAIPVLISGRDTLATAPTGSGKTAAFVIPALSLLGSPSKIGIRVLLLAPTKELVDQIHRETLRLCIGRRLKINLLKKSTVSNAIARQDKTLVSGGDLLVTTPMRLLSLLRASLIDLRHVKLIVMDEADKLFEKPSRVQRPNANTNEGNISDEDDDEEDHEGGDEKGERGVGASFLSQIDEILAACPTSGVQKCLFSATLGPFVQELATGFLHEPVSVTIGTVNAAATTIEQRLVFVGREEGKLLAMRQLVQEGLQPPVLLFLQSIERAKELFKELVYDGVNVDVIHADRTQQQRDEVIARFRRGDIWVLICTDLMARGVDFKAVHMVINYDLPQTPVAYIHRIGRTGRAGRAGLAVTLFTESDIPHLRSIANVMRLSGCEVPEWMLSIKQLNTKQKRHVRQAPPKRPGISTVSTYDKRKAAQRKQVVSQSKHKTTS